MARFQKVNVVRAAVFGISALLGAAFLQPSRADASAIRDMTFDLGTISKTTRDWDPLKGGSFSARYRLDKSGPPGTFIADGDAYGARGASSSGTMRGELDYGRTSKAVTNSYNFSLHKDTPFVLTINTRGQYGKSPFVGDFLHVEITGKDGYRYSGGVYGGFWNSGLINLKDGDYTLKITGRIGFANEDFMTSQLFQGYHAEFSVPGGDVPLPGAVILLGTALAGAGVYGRRKKAGKPSA